MRISRGALLRPYRAGDSMGKWPHILAAARGVSDPSAE
jgi:hypothetical protein